METEQLLEAQLTETDRPTEAGVAAALGAKAAKPHLLADGPLQRAYFAGGELLRVDLERPPRKHHAESVDSLVALATDSGAVWHSGDEVVLVLDNSDQSHRLDRVVWRLTPTEAWTNAINTSQPSQDQKGFVSRLTGPLRKPIRESTTGTALLDAARSVKFSTTDDQTGDVGHGKSSMGRSISASAAQAETFPKEVFIPCRRWAELDHVGTIELVVDVQAEDRKLNARPTIDEAAAAELTAQHALASYISGALKTAGKTTPVFAGKP